MQNRKPIFLFVVLVCAILISSCNQGTKTQNATQISTSSPVPTQAPTEAPTSTPTPEEPIYLSIIWHQHQPVYYKNPETGIYDKPWVRVHAAKDYVDMAAILNKYPAIHTTFNLTPSLIYQLDDFQAGAKDKYWVVTETPAGELTDDEKQFLLERFFDTNRKIIARFPRYQELLDKRDANETYTTQDFLDLQVLFNLAWTDPEWLAAEPLSTLVAKGRNYSEEDKPIVLAEHLRLINEVVPIHRELQDSGQIEVTMTPYTHPILPLLMSTRIALQANPTMELPSKEFAYFQDAMAQLQAGIEVYQNHFGTPPQGMWPAEGSVAQDIVFMLSKAGIQWMASDEGVLAASLGMESFNRDSREVVTEPDVLYRPYYVQSKQGDPVAIIFRDVVISDKVGFTYSGVSGTAAAQDFIDRIHAIRESLIESGASGPHLVSVILDGENAWEYYDNDGKEFLNSLYTKLSNDPLIRTVTPSEFLEMAPEQPKIDELWAGSWINHDFTTWIGESEENRAWEYLSTVREFLQLYISDIRQAEEEAIKQALEYMYFAEGSDWFWWFGSDQSSSNDEAFDEQFRNTLKQVYISLGAPTPDFLDVPIIPLSPVAAYVSASGQITVTVDGMVSEGEWDAAGVYSASGGVMAGGEAYFQDLAYGFSPKELFIKVSALPEIPGAVGDEAIELYFNVPGGGAMNNFSKNGSLLGFPANRLVEIRLEGGVLTSASILVADGGETWGSEKTLETVAQGDDGIELAINLEDIGNPGGGDSLNLRAIHAGQVTLAGKVTVMDTDILPGGGPAVLVVPDLGTMIVLLDITDPEGDDHGPGTYTYPTDAVFKAGCYDILNFQVGLDEKNIIFKFNLRGAVDNSWGSPNGLSVQTFDIYIDTDRDGEGWKNFLPGRNLALAEGFAWDYAITVEGWEPGIFRPGEGGVEKFATSSDFQILTDPAQRRVTIRVPRAILGENPEAWSYAAIIMSQEGYPSGGVMRVRDVNPVEEQWRVGGAPSDTNHTRVIDLVWMEGGVQEEWLSAYTPSQTSQTDLVETDFAQVEMLTGGQ